MRLASGDALVIGGPSRLIFHGVDRLIPTRPLPADLLAPEAGPVLPAAVAPGGRLNLTLRRVTEIRRACGRA